MAEEFAAAALCERRDGSVCGRCVSCRQIKDGVSPFIFRIDTAEDSGGELGEKKKTRKSAAKDSGKIKDHQIEEVIERARGGTLSSTRIFTIIEKAETITARGQNRLLKALEEPPEGLTFILVSENAEGLLETVRSRCQIVRPDIVGEEPADRTDAFTKRAVAAAAALIAGAPAADLWKEMDYFADSREKALRFAETAMVFYRDALVFGRTGRTDLLSLHSFEEEVRRTSGAASAESLTEAVHCCDRAVRDLKAMVSMKHALRYMMFDIQIFLHGVKR